MSPNALTANDHYKQNTFDEYSAIYDLIYRNKDYAKEARFVEDLIQRYARRSDTPASILDLACGTGRHALELAGMGFSVEGSDMSSGMVAVAQKSAIGRGLDVKFHELSFQNANAIPGTFNVVLAMFASLGYLTDFADFSLTLNNVAAKLSPDGIFIFDVWNGNAVLKQYSPYRVREEEDDQRKVMRVSRTTIDRVSQQATVRFEFKVEYAERGVNYFREYHHVRFYFPQEMNNLMSALGFEVLFRCPFLAVERTLTDDDWNMTYVVRKKLGKLQC